MLLSRSDDELMEQYKEKTPMKNKAGINLLYLLNGRYFKRVLFILHRARKTPLKKRTSFMLMIQGAALNLINVEKN